jgi:long-chain acyl-CoA synthetase
MNLYQSFAGVALRNAERTAVIDGETRITYGELLRKVEGMGAVLSAFTQQPAVGIYLPTSAGFVIAAYGAFRAGFAIVPLNLLLPPGNLGYVCEHAELDVIVTSEKLVDRLGEVKCKLILLEDLARAAAAGQAPPLQALEGRPTAGDEDLAILLYTSGTTGNPKGVRLTHRNIVSNIEGCLQMFEITPDDVILGILPLFHTFALTGTMGIPLHSGGTFVTHMRFQPDATLDAIQEHKVTILIAVPSMHRVLAHMQRHQPRDVSSLRFGIAGGEPLPPRIEREFEETFRVPLLQGYGLTETSPVISANPPEANKPGTAGRPLQGIDVRIMGDDGSEVPVGEVGEITVRGPGVMQGYHKRDDETAAMIRDGWLYTGDMGCVDADGYITITGRRKEMIIVGGLNVFPPEVEAVLSEHPGISHCAVIGLSSEAHGEQVKAIIVPRDETLIGNAEGLAALEKDIREYLKDKLAQFKMPRHYEFRAEVPLGPTGKVLKKAL